MRYGFTKPSKPHSSDVRKVKEYNAASPANINPSDESTHETDSAVAKGSRMAMLGLVSTRRCLAPST